MEVFIELEQTILLLLQVDMEEPIKVAHQLIHAQEMVVVLLQGLDFP